MPIVKITPENTIVLAGVTVGVLDTALSLLRKHGSVYIQLADFVKLDEVPTLAEALFS